MEWCVEATAWPELRLGARRWRRRKEAREAEVSDTRTGGTGVVPARLAETSGVVGDVADADFGGGGGGGWSRKKNRKK